MDSSGVVLTLEVWCADALSAVALKCDLLEQATKRFALEGIGIPFPQMTLVLKNDSQVNGSKTRIEPNERVMKNPLQLLQDHGQSLWLDYLRRSLITSGELKRLIEEDGLGGLTSNPSIFKEAIAGATTTGTCSMLQSHKGSLPRRSTNASR